jgi:hypothetical protein
MKTIVAVGILSVACLGVSPQAYSQSQGPSSVQMAGNCSITTNGNANNSTLVCNDLDPKVASQIKAILNGTERTQTAIKMLSDKLDQIIHNVSDRRLTPSQMQALEASARSICANFPEIDVTASDGNQEAQRFATDFVDAFKAVGCKADLALPIPGLRPDVTGVSIAVTDYKSVDPQVLELITILSNAGVQPKIAPKESNFFPGANFVLVIGAKE